MLIRLVVLGGGGRIIPIPLAGREGVPIGDCGGELAMALVKLEFRQNGVKQTDMSS